MNQKIIIALAVVVILVLVGYQNREKLFEKKPTATKVNFVGDYLCTRLVKADNCNTMAQYKVLQFHIEDGAANGPVTVVADMVMFTAVAPGNLLIAWADQTNPTVKESLRKMESFYSYMSLQYNPETDHYVGFMHSLIYDSPNDFCMTSMFISCQKSARKEG